MKKMKKQLFNQVLINEFNHSFIIVKRNTKFTSVISPFELLEDGTYNSNFVTPHSRAYRVQSLYNLIPKISTYLINQNMIYFDCVSKLPEDTFNNHESGWIHFNIYNEPSNVEEVEGGANEIFDIDIKMVIGNSYNESIIEYENQNKINFSTNSIKVFPVIMSKGFILTIVNKNECSCYVTLSNPGKGYIGTCLRKELPNITQNIFPIWPIFNLIADENINKLFLKKELVTELKPLNYNEKLLIKLSYNLDDSQNIKIQKIGIM